MLVTNSPRLFKECLPLVLEMTLLRGSHSPFKSSSACLKLYRTLYTISGFVSSSKKFFRGFQNLIPVLQCLPEGFKPCFQFSEVIYRIQSLLSVLGRLLEGLSTLLQVCEALQGPQDYLTCEII